MFRRKLMALEYMNPETFNINGEGRLKKSVLIIIGIRSSILSLVWVVGCFGSLADVFIFFIC